MLQVPNSLFVALSMLHGNVQNDSYDMIKYNDSYNYGPAGRELTTSQLSLVFTTDRATCAMLRLLLLLLLLL